MIGGKGAKNEPLKFELRHNLGDKTIADVCEAMIGAAFVTHFTSGYGDPSQMDEAVKATSTFVCSKDHDMQSWDDYRRNYVVPAYQTGESSASQRDLAERIKQSHNYSFKHPRLLRSAFLHPSVPKVWEGLPSYRKYWRGSVSTFDQPTDASQNDLNSSVTLCSIWPQFHISGTSIQAQIHNG